MPNWASTERIKLMKNFGAHVTLISKEEGGFIECVKRAKKFAKENNGFLANQFENEFNILAHYETTGEEIIKTIPEKLEAFVSGVGTGGTLMGISKKLKESFPNLLTVAVEPKKMPMIYDKLNNISSNLIQHKIEGIGDDFIPELVETKEINKIILIDDNDAINMSRKFAQELGLGIGISSGANFLGSVLLKNDIKGAVATLFADDNKKYLSTDLSKEIDLNDILLSNKIKLLTYEVV